MEFSIPEKRELNPQKIEILRYLLEREKPEWVDLILDLKVIARCGCGECPTTLLGRTFGAEIQTGYLMIDFTGKNQDGNLIGISVFGTQIMPTQLEFYSIDGLAQEISIPKISTLERADC